VLIVIGSASMGWEDGGIATVGPCLGVMIVELIEILSFMPLLPIHARANPLCKEYIIERLPRSHFDIIEFRRLSIGYV